MSEAFAWGVWENLGSPSVGIVGQERLAVAANLDGHLELFAVGSDGAVWHTWQTAPNGPWAGWWASFGQPSGVSFAVPSSSRIQVEQNADGRLEVFLMGNDNNMWHTWQVAPNVNWIGQWASLGRPDVNIQPVGGFLTSLVREAGGELEIFIENTDTGEVWSRWQNEPNGGWLDGWSSLSMPRLPFVPTIRSFSVVENTNGQREVLAIGSDGAIWHNAILEMTAHRWIGWGVVMGPPSGVELSVIETVRHNQDGRLELVCSASGGNFWHTWQSSPSASGWSGQWDNFQQPPGGTAQGFDMRLDADGQLEGITWGTDFFTYQIRQSAPNNGWTGWNVINRDVSVFSSAELVVGQNQDKRLEAFTHGSGDTIYHISQIR